MILYYECDMGCALHECDRFKKGEREIIRKVGSDNQPRNIRKATEDDINWVAGMGGYVPESSKENR